MIHHSCNKNITYLLTPWCRVLLEKLTGLQLVKKFPEFHGARRFITAITSVRHLSLSWAGPIQSIHPHPTSWISILILSTHLRLGLPSGLLPSGFPSKTLYTPHLLTHTRHMPSPSHSSRFYHPHNIGWGEQEYYGNKITQNVILNCREETMLLYYYVTCIHSNLVWGIGLICYFNTPPLARQHKCDINLYWMEAYYVIIFLHHAAKCSINMLVFNASLHSKSQKTKEKPEPDMFSIFPITF